MAVHLTLNQLYPFVGGGVGSSPTRATKCLMLNYYDYEKII